MSEIEQGEWTRIRPLQRDEMDPYTHAGMVAGELTWGNFKNNLCKVMAYTPRLLQTEIEYCNSFIFDPATFRGDVQESGFNDRFIKELVISKTSLINRSRYSITHHSFIGMFLFKSAGREEEGRQKLLHLHKHEEHPDIYTEKEKVILNYVAKVTVDAHDVTDAEFAQLRKVLLADNKQNGGDSFNEMPEEKQARFVDSQIVELTWLCGHFCLLNRWFTVLQVPDEGEKDEDDFLKTYAEVVPQDIRDRNEEILNGDF